MDGEFDREIDDDRWGPVMRTWLPLLVQVQKMAKAEGVLQPSEKRQKKEKKGFEELTQTLKDLGKNGTECEPLGQIFWRKYKDCTNREWEARIEEEKAGPISKRKWKKEKETQEGHKREWMRKALQWQGIEHQMIDEDWDGFVRKRPPPYTPAPPTGTNPSPSAPRSLYPILKVEQGEVLVSSSAPEDACGDMRGSRGSLREEEGEFSSVQTYTPGVKQQERKCEPLGHKVKTLQMQEDFGGRHLVDKEVGSPRKGIPQAFEDRQLRERRLGFIPEAAGHKVNKIMPRTLVTQPGQMRGSNRGRQTDRTMTRVQSG